MNAMQGAFEGGGEDGFHCQKTIKLFQIMFLFPPDGKIILNIDMEMAGEDQLVSEGSYNKRLYIPYSLIV